MRYDKTKPLKISMNARNVLPASVMVALKRIQIQMVLHLLDTSSCGRCQWSTGAGYIFYKYRLRSYMDLEIMAIMSQYMPPDNHHSNEVSMEA
ncbi:hypothetical protein LWI28_024502 [Acer negundo]|uniref:Uncharacterized protein n=1 Tax=Acer negundo TaxID=4023 RepID=A0AAD5JSA6_ACENE|nr:hypothetical protein LWI28_024502 [Acer negundo]